MSKVKHIALFKFKPEVTDDQITDIFDQVLNATEEIPGIEDYVSGPNNSPEGLNQGYTHGFVMTFVDAASRDGYLTHAEHEKIKQLLQANVDSVLAFDFEL
ncbi:MAG TPA: Dabb family protein [Verrucomicrobiae bacterium]